MHVLIAACILSAPLDGGGATAQVRGKVLLSGSAPEGRPVAVTKDQHACGHHVNDETWVVSPAGGLANVVVHLEPKGDAAQAPRRGKLEEVVVDQVGCRYVPRVTTFPVGTTVVIKNSDATLHNTHTYLQMNGRDGRTLFNLALPAKGMQVKKTIREVGVIKYTCDAGHPWMRAWSVVHAGGAAVVTGADGSFALPDLAPGRYRLWTWHEAGGETEQTVEVRAGEVREVEVRYPSPVPPSASPSTTPSTSPHDAASQEKSP